MIVVFGAGGFIGTYLVDALVKAGIEVLATDKDPIAQEYYESISVPFRRNDITDSVFNLPVDNVDAVVNLACLQPVNVSQREYNPAKYINVNVIGTLNILEYCRSVGANRLVYTVSHRGVQGAWFRGETITEEIKRELKYTGDYSMFSISEAAAQDCIEHYNQQYGFKNIVLRLPPVYGYGPHLEGYSDGKPLKSGFMNFIEKAIKGEEIEVWGDEQRGRDIIYVKDVVNAILLALQSKEASGIYNIASGKKISLIEEVCEIIDIYSVNNKKSRIVMRPEKRNGIEEFVYDISKARKELQWFPEYYLDSMLYDIKKEMESKRFEFLIRKRQEMFGSKE